MQLNRVSIQLLFACVVVTALGCGGNQVEMPRKIAPPPTEPAVFSQRPDLGKPQ
jgi:hypothetical protein